MIKLMRWKIRLLISVSSMINWLLGIKNCKKSCRSSKNRQKITDPNSGSWNKLLAKYLKKLVKCPMLYIRNWSYVII